MARWFWSCKSTDIVENCDKKVIVLEWKNLRSRSCIVSLNLIKYLSMRRITDALGVFLLTIPPFSSNRSSPTWTFTITWWTCCYTPDLSKIKATVHRLSVFRVYQKKKKNRIENEKFLFITHVVKDWNLFLPNQFMLVSCIHSITNSWLDVLYHNMRYKRIDKNHSYGTLQAYSH